MSNSRYDTIMREYGRRQTENHHKLEERCQEIHARLPVVRQPEAETAERSVACTKKLLEGNKSILDRLREDLGDLREQKPLITRAADHPDDYLGLYYRYPDCRDMGPVDGRRYHCFLQTQMKLLHVQFNLEDVLEWKNFNALSYEYYDDTETPPQLGITSATYMRRVVVGCREFVQDFDEEHDSLLFTGNIGVGKTFLTNYIARELMDDFHSVIYLAANDLFDVFSRNKFDYDNVRDMKDMYRSILDYDLLIIDDLRTELNDNFTPLQLFYCINERMNMSRPTIIFTNLTLVRFRDPYTDHVTPRTMGGYRIIPSYGGDIRLLKK